METYGDIMYSSLLEQIVEEQKIADEYFLNEGFIPFDKIKDAILSILDRIVEFLKKIKAYISKRKKNHNKKIYDDILRTVKGTPGGNNIWLTIDLEKYNLSDTFELSVPNAPKILSILKSIMVESYDNIVMKTYDDVIKNDTSKKEYIYTYIFNDPNHSTWSDDNNYLFIIKDYLYKLTGINIKNGIELNKYISQIVQTNERNIVIDTREILRDICMGSDKFIVINKYHSELDNDAYNTIKDISSYIDISTKKINNLKIEVKKLNNIDKDLMDALHRVVNHYHKFITGINISNISNYYNNREYLLLGYINKVVKAYNQEIESV